jgi:hypothetical protein
LALASRSKPTLPSGIVLAIDSKAARGFAVHSRNAVQTTNEFYPPILATEFAIGDDAQADRARSHPGSLRRRPHVDRRR